MNPLDRVLVCSIIAGQPGSRFSWLFPDQPGKAGEVAVQARNATTVLNCEGSQKSVRNEVAEGLAVLTESPEDLKAARTGAQCRMARLRTYRLGESEHLLQRAWIAKHPAVGCEADHGCPHLVRHAEVSLFSDEPD